MTRGRDVAVDAMAKVWGQVAAVALAGAVLFGVLGSVFASLPSGRGAFLTLRAQDRAVHLRGKGCLGLAGGSGTLVGADVIVTSGHVANGIEHLEARLVGDITETAAVTHIDTKLDIAVLRLGDAFEYSALEFGDADVGDEGSVFIRDAEGVVHAKPYVVERRIRAETDNVGRTEIVERRSLQLEAKIERGDSGALLIDRSSHGVGVVWSTSRNLGDVGYATRGDEIAAVLDAERTNPSGPLRCN